jgi:hypothetical protein
MALLRRDAPHKVVGVVAPLIRIAIIVVVGAISLYEIDKFVRDGRLGNLLKILVVLSAWRRSCKGFCRCWGSVFLNRYRLTSHQADVPSDLPPLPAGEADNYRQTKSVANGRDDRICITEDRCCDAAFEQPATYCI